MDRLDPAAQQALASLVRRRPDVARLSPMKVLEIVTRDGFSCRICQASVAVHPRTVLLLSPQEAGGDEYISVCDSCRLEVIEIRAAAERDTLMEEATTRYREAIEGMLQTDDLPDLVNQYFDEAGPFAGSTFDLVGVNDPWRFTTDDLLAVSFLDTPIRASAWRAMERQAQGIVGLLLGIDPDICLWELEGRSDSYVAADSLWSLLLNIHGMGVTRVSKLMARKRPQLIPILDSRVREFFGDTKGFWLSLGRVLQDDDLRRRVRSLAPNFSEAELSTLRILDVAVWRYQRGLPPGTSEDSDD